MNHPAHICDLILNAAVSEQKDQPAFIFPESTLTWSELEFDVRAVAGALLELGIKPGDTVAVLLPNLPLHPILAFAIPMIGAAYLPIDSSRPVYEQAQLLRCPVSAAVFSLESQASELVRELQQVDINLPVFPVGENGFILGDTWPRSAKPYDDTPVGNPDDVAVRWHTSGVSQECQLVPLTHENLLSATQAVRKRLQVLPTSVLYGTHAFYSSFGYLFQLLLPAWAACTLHTCRHWSAHDVARMLHDTSITAYLGAAAHFEQLLPELQALAVADESAQDSSSVHDEEPSADVSDPALTNGISLAADSSTDTDSVHLHSPLRKLRFALCAGAHDNFEMLSEFANSLGCPVVTVYGSAEASGIITLNPVHFDPSHPESVGRVISGMEICIRDDEGKELLPDQIGEIWVKGTNVFSGYENSSLTLDEEGWHATSDIGYLDVDHWLYLIARKEDRIIRGGFHVYPQEVEAVLMKHDHIKDCAVVARQDTNLGQEIVAFLVTGNDHPGDQEISDFCANHLPRYKIPTLFMFVDAIPRSKSGFIMRRELRERLHSPV